MVRILLVDDEPDIVMLARGMLEKEGFEVTEAYNGEECLSKLKDEEFDMILLDVMMPGDNGWEVCEKIKANEKTKDTPVVMFTVRSEAESVKKGKEYGVAAQVDKPYNSIELVDTVKAVLEKSSD